MTHDVFCLPMLPGQVLIAMVVLLAHAENVTVFQEAHCMSLVGGHETSAKHSKTVLEQKEHLLYK